MKELSWETGELGDWEFPDAENLNCSPQYPDNSSEIHPHKELSSVSSKMWCARSGHLAQALEYYLGFLHLVSEGLGLSHGSAGKSSFLLMHTLWGSHDSPILGFSHPHARLWLHSWLQPGPAPVIVHICGMNQWMKHYLCLSPFLSVCFCMCVFIRYDTFE